MPDDRTRVTLVQSAHFPNCWSLKFPPGDHRDYRAWRDPLFKSGAMAAEQAVQYARANNLRITEVVSIHGEGVDSWVDVIAGIEIRSGAPVLEPERPANVPEDAICHVLGYSEVCCHMKVANTLMWVAPVGHFMAQLYMLDGTPFSIPITRGEAGLRATHA